MSDENNSQNVAPDTPGQSQPAAAAPVAPQVINQTPPAPVTPAPQEPAQHPDLNSVQTNKAIEYFKKNPEVLKHVNEQVADSLPDFNPSPERFVTVRDFTLHNAIAQYQLSAEDAELLASVDTKAIPAFAARLAQKADPGATVNPTAESEPKTPKAPKPERTGKASAPASLGTGDLLAQAFGDFKESYYSGKR